MYFYTAHSDGDQCHTYAARSCVSRCRLDSLHVYLPPPRILSPCRLFTKYIYNSRSKIKFSNVGLSSPFTLPQSIIASFTLLERSAFQFPPKNACILVHLVALWYSVAKQHVGHLEIILFPWKNWEYIIYLC